MCKGNEKVCKICIEKNARYKWFNLMIKLMKIKPNIMKIWPHTPDNSYRILIIGGSWSGKTNVLLNLIENQPDIDKIY